MKLATWTMAMMLLAGAAYSAPVEVTITGEVEYNQVTIGEFASVDPGDPVSISFMLDSNSYVDSPSVPTRGYVIDQGSFLLTMGPASALLKNPFPGTPYFVVRNNDPAVDGFFFSGGPGVDNPNGLTLDEPANVAGTRFFLSSFAVSYEGSRLSSLDILGALGVYDYTGLGSFYFVIQDLSFEPIGFIFTQMTISAPVSVEATTWGGVKALYR